MSLPPDRTGDAPSARRIGPAGQKKIDSLARMCICRPSAGVSQPATSGGSAFDMWLPTTISGPVRGRSLMPSMRTLASTRRQKRAR